MLSLGLIKKFKRLGGSTTFTAVGKLAIAAFLAYERMSDGSNMQRKYGDISDWS
jgi:hypothetical protein